MKKNDFKRKVVVLGLIILIFSVALWLIVPALFSTSFSSKSKFYLDEKEIRLLEIQVAAGNNNSARRLADYYLMSNVDIKRGFFWLEQSAMLGDGENKKRVKGMIDFYGLTRYREIMGRTNESFELELLQAIDSGQTNTQTSQ